MWDMEHMLDIQSFEGDQEWKEAVTKKGFLNELEI